MKIGYRVCIAIVALIFCSSCGGGGAFIPAIGPFTGEFVSEESGIGSFSLTTTSGLLGGTGTIIHNNQPVTVVISAVINGQSLSGTVKNNSLGAGTFTGAFTDTDNISGQFNYQDIGLISITSGTWTASIPSTNSD